MNRARYRAGRRGRDGRPPPAGAGRGPGAGGGRPRRAVDRARGLDARAGRPTLDGRGLPVTLLPGRGIVRSVRPRRCSSQPRRRGRPGRGRGAAALGVVARPDPRVVVVVGRLRQRARLPGRGRPGGYRWCWSTSTPCPARPTGCSGGSPGPAPWRGGQPLPVRGGHRGPGAGRDRRGGPARPADRAAAAAGRSGCPRPADGGRGSAGRSGPAGSTRPSSAWPSGGPDRGDLLDLPRGRAARLGRGPPSRWSGSGRPIPPGLALVPSPLRGSDGAGLRRRRRRGVPGRGHDRGRAGRGRRPVGPGAAARGAGGPPDGQRPGPRAGRGGGPGARRAVRRAGAGRRRSTPCFEQPAGSRPWGEAARSLGRPDAAAAGARVVEASARPRRRAGTGTRPRWPRRAGAGRRRRRPDGLGARGRRRRCRA